MLDIPHPETLNGNQIEGVNGLHVNTVKAGETKKQKLEKILKTQKKIAEAKSKEITFSNPILKHNENAILHPKTINVLQGKAGVHKSRLAEIICSVLLLRPGHHNDLLQFQANPFGNFTVCYVDTERNHSDQLPFALQQIQLNAGYSIEENVENFDFISLLEFDREDRFDLLNVYLEDVRSHFNNHIFIVLDVITDCISNFNDPSDSMRLIDMMNQSINQYDVTFLCIIHENPGSTDKARGHLGTEIMNKASTVIQVGFEKDYEQASMDLIKINYLKCRNSKKHEPIYAQYSENDKKLILASPEKVKEALERKRHKAPLETLIDQLGVLLEEPLSREDLLIVLREEFDCSKRILEDRLKEIIDSGMQFNNNKGKLCVLGKQMREKKIFYFLSPPPSGNLLL